MENHKSIRCSSAFFWVWVIGFLLPKAAVTDTFCEKSLSYLAKGKLYVSTNTVKYAKEVVQSRGRRILLKEVANGPEPDTRYLHLLTLHSDEDTGVHFLLRNHFTDLVQYIPRKITKSMLGKGYDLTPIKAFHHWIIRPPTRWVTTRAFGKEMDWTLPVYLMGGFGGWTVAWNYIDEVDEDLKLRKMVNELAVHAPEWDKIIESDIRYQDIKRALAEGELTPDEARIAAGMHNEMLFAYYDFMVKNPNSLPEPFMDSPLFERVKNWKETGVPQIEGYRYLPGFSSAVDESQINELTQHTHRTLALLEILSIWISHPEEIQKMAKKNKSIQKILSELQNDPFTKKLEHFRKTGKITQAKLLYYLQEDVEWQRNFAEWKILRVQKLRKSNGKYLTVPLTLEDIRQETLQTISAI